MDTERNLFLKYMYSIKCRSMDSFQIISVSIKTDENKESVTYKVERHHKEFSQKSEIGNLTMFQIHLCH